MYRAHQGRRRETRYHTQSEGRYSLSTSVPELIRETGVRERTAFRRAACDFRLAGHSRLCPLTRAANFRSRGKPAKRSTDTSAGKLCPFRDTAHSKTNKTRGRHFMPRSGEAHGQVGFCQKQSDRRCGGTSRPRWSRSICKPRLVVFA